MIKPFSESRQLSLISDQELANMVEVRATMDVRADNEYIEGDYTLERFAAREPRLLQAVIRLRGAGMAIKDVAKLLVVGFKTVMAVDSVYAADIATCKARVGKRWMEVAELAADAARERLLTGPMLKEGLRDIVVAGATAMDKALLAAGEATDIRRVEFEAPGLADFGRELAAMGLGAGMPAQKDPVEAQWEMAGEEEPVPQETPGPAVLHSADTDMQSVALPLQIADNQRIEIRGVIPVQSEGQKGAILSDPDGDADPDGFEEGAGGRARVGGRG